jgi:molybdopterin/thiamine biosynthesis adenylyltransferase
MRLEFEDGWPFRHPRIFVEGMTTDHVNARGEVCLWQEGDPSRQWVSLESFEERVAAWAAAAEQGFPDDQTLDAHLYFESQLPGFATIDLMKLAPQGRPGHKGNLAGTWSAEDTVLTLGKPSQGGDVKGSWYFVSLEGALPRDLASLRGALGDRQRHFLNGRLRDMTLDEERVVLLVWEESGIRNALAVVLLQGRDALEASAIEIAPTDRVYLERRAGPDFDALQQKDVVAFGVGAVGSNVALRLAECGLRSLTLVDREMLRPSNIVRHVAPRTATGWNKAEATQLLVPERVPWTKVACMKVARWHPDQLKRVLSQRDLVVDATGNAGFTDLLSVCCEDLDGALVSAALFREGAVGRVRRQARGGDTPIYARGADERYPLIPTGDERFGLEPGCSAPVNNASPAAVAAVAALTTMVVSDALTKRYEYDDETIDVYRPLEESPFDRLGRVNLE